MALVVLSFTASLSYSHFLLQPIDEHALSIVENAVPSLQHLANMRVELTRLGEEVRALVAAGGSSSSPSPSTIDTSWMRIESEFRLYRNLSPSSDEFQWIPVVDQRLSELERAIHRVVDASGGEITRGMLPELFEPALAQADAATGMLQRLNETEARVSATRILALRHKAMLMAALLGGASLAIALLATLFVLRVLRARAQIAQQYLRLQTERSSELEAFSGRVAHDLRDPLSAVALQTSAIRCEHQLGPGLTRYFDAIDRQVERMSQVIDALLEFARAGAVPSLQARAELTEVLNTVLASLRPRLETIHAELTVPPVEPLQIACTDGALSSVLSNLIGNAVKFVVEGSELPRRIAIRVSEEALAVRVEVEDNGPGIPSEAAESIFKPFQRLEGTRQPGIGLGLATVKKLVEAYRGQLGVHSRTGKGSVFWFELPKAPPGCPPAR